MSVLPIQEAINKNTYTAITCGGGVNFTALIYEWFKRGLKKPDVIIFADTGAELKSTYSHLATVNNWLFSIGWPQISVCNTVDRKGNILKLNEVCLSKGVLPAPAYGFKSCSLRFKTERVNVFLNNHPPARKVWGDFRKLTEIKNKITKVIGFDYGEDHRAINGSCEKYDVVYPLVDWEMDRDDCIASIKNSPLPVPSKSSCFMCPNMKTHEILNMAKTEPESLQAALEIEDKFLSSDEAKGRKVMHNVLRRLDDNSFIGVVDDMNKIEVAHLLGIEHSSPTSPGQLPLENIPPSAVAYLSKEEIWQKSSIRGLGRTHSWRDVLANPELIVGSEMPCMCND